MQHFDHAREVRGTDGDSTIAKGQILLVVIAKKIGSGGICPSGCMLASADAFSGIGFSS